VYLILKEPVAVGLSHCYVKPVTTLKSNMDDNNSIDQRLKLSNFIDRYRCIDDQSDTLYNLGY